MVVVVAVVVDTVDSPPAAEASDNLELVAVALVGTW